MCYLPFYALLFGIFSLSSPPMGIYFLNHDCFSTVAFIYEFFGCVLSSALFYFSRA